MFYFGTYIYIFGSIQPIDAYIKDSATQTRDIMPNILSPMHMPDFAGDYRKDYLTKGEKFSTNYFMNMQDKIWNTDVVSQPTYTCTKQSMTTTPKKKSNRRKMRYAFLLEKRARNNCSKK
jgi:hypothetical protein